MQPPGWSVTVTATRRGFPSLGPAGHGGASSPRSRTARCSRDPLSPGPAVAPGCPAGDLPGACRAAPAGLELPQGAPAALLSAPFPGPPPRPLQVSSRAPLCGWCRRRPQRPPRPPGFPGSAGSWRLQGQEGRGRSLELVPGAGSGPARLLQAPPHPQPGRELGRAGRRGSGRPRAGPAEGHLVLFPPRAPGRAGPTAAPRVQKNQESGRVSNSRVISSCRG